jgi:lambda family phage portal protein
VVRKRPGILDRALALVGLKRNVPTQTRSFFGGAAGNRLNLDWVMGPSSVDDEVKADGRKLRDRARSLRRDNPWAARYVALQVEGILGAHGITMQARVGTTRGDVNERTNALIESRFDRWAESFADVAGRLSFAEHVRLAVETWKCEGEAFLEIVPLPLSENPFGFALRALDPDQIDDTLNHGPAAGVNEIKMGVELNARGRPLYYHVWTRHPSETAPGGKRSREKIPASRIIHLGRPSRAGQTRTVTPFAPVLQDLKMLGGLQEAVLVLQRTAACKMGFVSVDPELTDPLKADDGNASVNWDAEPGRIEQLPLGMQFTPWDPGQPGAEYDPFTKNVLRAIAAGLGVSYASLTGDLSEANYSSARVGMLSERDGYSRDRLPPRPVSLGWRVQTW